jgi:hypothetical protein
MPKAKELSQETSTKLTKVSQESRNIKKSNKDAELSSQGSANDSPAKVVQSSLPKKTLSSYLCFINARRPGFTEANPEFSICEVVSALAKVWNSLTVD